MMNRNGFKKFMNLISKNATKFINENRLLSDPEFQKVFSNYFLGVKGPKQVKRDWSPAELFFKKIFYGFFELLRCFDRLEQVEVFLKIYKNNIEFKKKEITKTVYFKYHIEKYLEEMYIIKERLIYINNIILKNYRSDNPLVSNLKKFEVMIYKTFEGIIQIRSLHVHENRFTDDDINRLETYDLLLKTGKMPTKFEKIVNVESNKVIKKWIKKVRRNNREVMKLLDVYFSNIQTLIFDEKGQLRT